MSRLTLLVALFAPLAAAAGVSAEEDPDARFRAANEAALAGDYPAALADYRGLAADGHESASLYWNWAQAARGRGAQGEAMWALLRARELEPGETRLSVEIDRVREAASLDPAEIAPEPLAGLGRAGRRFRLAALALVLIAVSLLLHALARRRPGWPGPAAWTCGVLALLLAAPTLGGAFARPTAVVVTPEATLLDAASRTAATVGTLREGEVVPVLAESAEYLRIEDSSGARGWARLADVWPLDRPPAPQRQPGTPAGQGSASGASRGETQ